MSFQKFLKPKEETVLIVEESAEYSKSDADYYNTFDPDTGLRFDIPMLDTLDPSYYFKYVDHMKRREVSPETFEKLLNWD